jgi:succinate dehydrogenase / fumarate reductase cytochrome b subunit
MALSSDARRARPRFLNLFLLRYPVGAVCSFAHRVSGVLLALFLPAFVILLRASLAGPSGYEDVATLLRQPVVKAVAFVLFWALAHHVLAGVRHLLKDIDLGATLGVARRSAWSVNTLGVLLALLALGALW